MTQKTITLDYNEYLELLEKEKPFVYNKEIHLKKDITIRHFYKVSLDYTNFNTSGLEKYTKERIIDGINNFHNLDNTERWNLIQSIYVNLGIKFDVIKKVNINTDVKLENINNGYFSETGQEVTNLQFDELKSLISNEPIENSVEIQNSLKLLEDNFRLKREIQKTEKEKNERSEDLHRYKLIFSEIREDLHKIQKIKNPFKRIYKKINLIHLVFNHLNNKN